LPTTKIVVVTQRDRESDIRHALELGVQGYLSLGCGLEEMAEGVIAVHRGRRHLGQSAAHRIAESFGHQALTSREIDVLRLVVAGYANKMVANELEIALGTVKCHVKSILEKLGAKTRTEAAAVAQRRGLCGHERDVPAEWTSEWGVPPSSQSHYATHIRLNEQAPLA
jgi:DNA-binding NarL/FixJ family response regulator